MAMANPCLQKEWGEWKRGMGNGKRKRLVDRIRRWINVEVSVEEEEESVEEEDEDASETEVEGKKEEEAKEEGSDVEEEEVKVREVKENEEEESELKNKMCEEEDEEKSATGEEVNEVRVIDREDEEEVKTAEEREEEEEEKEVEEEQEEGEKEIEKDNEESDRENEEKIRQEEEEDEDEEEEEGEKEIEEDDEENDSEGEERVRQEEEEEDEEEEEEEPQEQNEEQFQFEDVLQNQESPVQEDEEHNDEDNISDSLESDKENSDLTRSETESSNSERLKVLSQSEDRCRNEFFQTWSIPERKEGEEESDKMTVTESWITLEDFQDDLLEEESTDEGEAEDEDGDDEDEVKIYCKDGYPAEIFHTLNEFRNSGLLTDLTLHTEDGKSFLVHSPIMAAVSSLIWKNLSRNICADKREDVIHMWSINLEVDHVGLEAIVEFSYTGFISHLNKDNMEQVKAAAQTLSAPRVLSFCMEEEEASTQPPGKKKERISAEQQLMMSLQAIKRLWVDQVGCDVVLEALRGSLHVHRVILAVSSDYFRGMFTLGMKESHQLCVSLPFLLSSELNVLIDCSYSGVLPLSWSCVFEITSTALQLQYQPALSLCLQFLQKELNPDSCLDVVAFAEAYELVQLLEVADDFVLRQFQKVACTSKFKDLPAKQLFKYLNSRSLCVPSELVVFKAVVAWIQAKPKSRLRLAKELMKTIHFPLMTFKEFKEVRSQNMWSNHSLTELYEAVFEEFCSNETTVQNRCRVYLPKESLVLIGGDQISEDLGNRSISRDLWFGNSLRNHTGIKKAMEWRKLGELPEPARFCHEVAVLKGQLYVFGGKKYYGIGDTLNSVYRYDPLQNSWECMAEMQERRCSFSVVILDGNLYAIGGHCDPDHIDTVERYCPNTNSWSFTWPLDLPLSGHVARVLHGRIFISGGRNNDYLCLSSMFLYHPEIGSTYLANMTKPRAHHCMEALGDFLYVAGGVTTDDNVNVIDQLACEVYSPATDTWTAFIPLPVPHVGAGSAVLEGKFYVLGGYSQEDYSDTKMVHRFDATTWRWENMGKMPGPNNDIRASLLCLPKHFRL